MYPAAKNHFALREFTPDIPEQLQRAFVSTVDVLNSRNYTATAVLAGRTLEGIFKLLAPDDMQRATLAKLIRHVSENRDLAAPLKSLAHAIRDGRNLGAHFHFKKEPGEDQARQMVQLLDYLISYLFVLPTEIEKLERALEPEQTEASAQARAQAVEPEEGEAGTDAPTQELE
jgi:hypothetical protein